MAAEISVVLDLLRPAAAGDRDPPAHRLCTRVARAGLEELAGALAADPPPERAPAGAVLAAARAVVSTILSSSVEQLEPIVAEIAERSLEFCLLYLEKSSYGCDDFGLLNEVAFFMESVLLNGTPSKVYTLEPSIINDVIEQWASVPAESERLSPPEILLLFKRL